MSTPHAVHVYWLATGVEETRRSAALLDVLAGDERERHDRLVHEIDRHHYRAAHALTRAALSWHQQEVSPSAWRFRTTSHGRPEILAPPSTLRFNLSHTSGLVACAVTEGNDPGIDVEDSSRPVELAELAESVFAPAELAALRRASPGEDAIDLFFEIWTLKEAYIKALGLGFSAELRTFWFEPRPPPVRFASEAGPSHDGRWRFHQARPTPRHRLAVAVSTDEPVAFVVHPMVLSSLLVSLTALR